MSVGIDFFSTGDEVLIKVTNLNDVTENKNFYECLVGCTLKAKPVAQFYFERSDGAKQRYGDPIDGKNFFSFTVHQAMTALENESKKSDVWEKLKPDTVCYLIISACEVILYRPVEPFIEQARLNKEENKPCGFYDELYLVEKYPSLEDAKKEKDYVTISIVADKDGKYFYEIYFHKKDEKTYLEFLNQDPRFGEDQSDNEIMVQRAVTVLNDMPLIGLN